MKVILLGKGNILLNVAKKIKQDLRIELSGVICNKLANQSSDTELWTQFHKLGVEFLTFSEENLKRADLIFACNYGKKVPREYVEKYKFLNCHAGILPKYRGFSANPWAIMNGETQVGYTIHQMDAYLDNGDIFYVGKFPVSRQETYAEVYDKIFDDMSDRICDILTGVYEGKIMPVRQKGYGVYCSRFYAEMGDLTGFDMTSEYIFNLYRCMAKPHGTGVYFYYKERKYFVGRVVSGTDMQIENYLGIPGKIVNCMNGAIWVKTQDNVVVLSEIAAEDGKIVDEDYFKIGNLLGK